MSNNKWILFINYKAYPCDVGGLEVFNYYLINELSKSYKTHQLTFCDNCNNNGNVIVHKLKKLKFPKITQPLLTFLFLFKHIKKIRFVHVSFSKEYWTHWLIYVIIKKILGIKYIMTIHGGSLAEWKPKWPYKLFFKHAEFITGVSDRIINEYEKRAGRNVIFTPPLIPFTILNSKNEFRKKWSVNPDSIVLLYVGSIKPLKAVDSLIEALNIFTKEKIQKNNLIVLIAGDGESKSELEQRVISLNLQDNIKFLGNIKREEVPELYNLADMYTICSEFEGLPISLLEAFANNLPCITSDAPGLHNLSINNKNSLLFKTRDVNDYAQKIELLLSDLELQKQLKNSANLYYENHFSYNTLVNDFKNIIDKI